MLQHALHERNEINKRFICTVPHEKDVPDNRSCPAHLLTAFRCVCFILCVLLCVCVCICTCMSKCAWVCMCMCNGYMLFLLGGAWRVYKDKDRISSPPSWVKKTVVSLHHMPCMLLVLFCISFQVFFQLNFTRHVS